nr:MULTISPECIES: ATP-binding protein [Kribbella]
MGAARVRPSLRLAGRGVEQQLLAAALESAASGHPCAVMVHGEAGAGKTRMVRDVCTGLGDEAQVLWGTCVHFGEASVPFAPVIGALQGWLAQTDAAIRAEVLSGAGELGTLLPALGNERSSEPGRLLPLIDSVFNRLAGRAPTVLVVDDLHRIYPGVDTHPDRPRRQRLIVARLALLLAIALSHAAHGKQLRATNHATRLGMKKPPGGGTGL